MEISTASRGSSGLRRLHRNALVLVFALWLPYFIYYVRRGKAKGHTWFTWWKPRVTPTLATTLVDLD